MPRPNSGTKHECPELLQEQSRFPRHSRHDPGQSRATCCWLLAADIAAVLLARWLGAGLWSLVNPLIGIRNQFDLWMSLALFLIVYAASDSISGFGLGPGRRWRIVLGGLLSRWFSQQRLSSLKRDGVYSRGVFLSSGLLQRCLPSSSRRRLPLLRGQVLVGNSRSHLERWKHRPARH